MDFDRYVPARIRSNYTLKMVAVIAVVVLVTVATGILLYANASDRMEAKSDAEFDAHATDRATIVALWAESNANLADGLAETAASDGTTTADVADRVETAASERSDRIVAIHYVDRETGRIRASTADNVDGPLSLSVDPADETVVTGAGPSGDDVWFLSAADDGVIVVEASADFLRERLDGEAATTTVVRDGEVLVGSTRPELDDPAVAAWADAGTRTSATLDTEHRHVVDGTDVRGTDLQTVTHVPVSGLYEHRSAATAAITALLYVVFLNLALVGVTVGGNLSLALRQLTERARSIGEGDLDVELATDRTDEVGVLYEEFDSMRASLRESLADARTARERAEKAREDAERAREEAERSQRETERLNERLEAEAKRYGDVMEACADGDLTERLDPEVDSAAMESIATAFNDMIEELAATIADVDAFAAEVRQASDDVEAVAADVREATESVDRTVADIADGATEQTESIESVSEEVDGLSASIEEIAATTDEVASESDRVAQLGADGRETARETVEEMRAIERTTGSLVESIERLDDGVEEIGDVVDLIADIAEQTNILALNASIEAARAGGDAGEAGDGFGVVADEVKALATETQDAVSEIEEMVADLQRRTEESTTDLRDTEERITEGIESVQELADAMQAICDGVEAVDGGLGDINRTTDHQASSAQEVVSMVDRVSEIAQSTSEQSESVAASSSTAADSVADVADEASHLAAQARDLEAALAEFRIDVESTARADGGRGE